MYFCTGNLLFVHSIIEETLPHKDNILRKKNKFSINLVELNIGFFLLFTFLPVNHGELKHIDNQNKKTENKTKVKQISCNSSIMKKQGPLKGEILT